MCILTALNRQWVALKIMGPFYGRRVYDGTYYSGVQQWQPNFGKCLNGLLTLLALQLDFGAVPEIAVSCICNALYRETLNPRPCPKLSKKRVGIPHHNATLPQLKRRASDWPQSSTVPTTRLSHRIAMSCYTQAAGRM